jgi:hypothetical protein
MDRPAETRACAEGDETAVTMLDVLQDEQELEEDANVGNPDGFSLNQSCGTGIQLFLLSPLPLS